MTKIRELIVWLMTFGIIVLGIYLLFWIKTESFECLSNPYSYSIKLLEEANSANVSCICTVYKTNGATVMLTKDGFKNIPIQESNSKDLNFSYFQKLPSYFKKIP